MDQEQLRQLLEQVRGGAVGIDEALGRLKHMPFEDLGFAKIDHHRAIRVGMPEVIFGKGKAPEHIVEIAARLLERSPNLLATRVEPDAAAMVCARFPDAEYHAKSGVLRVWRDRALRGKGTIVIACAGTSDIPVAEEAHLTAEIMGNCVETVFDIGVAGIHRLMSNRDRLTQARVCVVCAGMEGALPSVVGGLVSCPVIAVPTSVGYGAAFGGVAALLGMLNSCAAGVTVVNIDNGFGAAAAASRILNA